MKISNSKRQLAKLLIEAGVTQFPDGSNWAAQDKSNESCVDRAVSFFGGKHKPKWFGRIGKMWKCAVPDTTFLGYDVSVVLPTLIPNWHQTVLSRDEFDQIIAEAVVPSEPDADGWIEWHGGERPVDGDELVVCKVRSGREWRDGKAIMAKVLRWSHTGGIADIIAYRLHKPEQANPEPVAESKPTIEQLAADYRNKLDYADRKQDEAYKAKVESGAALSELEKAIAAIGFAITPICAAAQEYATPNWRNWVRGDEIKCKKTPPGAVKSIGLTGYVSKVYGDCVEVAFEHHIAVAFGGLIDECFEFVNRPAK